MSPDWGLRRQPSVGSWHFQPELLSGGAEKGGPRVAFARRRGGGIRPRWGVDLAPGRQRRTLAASAPLCTPRPRPSTTLKESWWRRRGRGCGRRGRSDRRRTTAPRKDTNRGAHPPAARTHAVDPVVNQLKQRGRARSQQLRRGLLRRQPRWRRSLRRQRTAQPPRIHRVRRRVEVRRRLIFRVGTRPPQRGASSGDVGAFGAALGGSVRCDTRPPPRGAPSDAEGGGGGSRGRSGRRRRRAGRQRPSAAGRGRAAAGGAQGAPPR
mmetsp:Transcript_140582/g.448196  ORF Transcript_140582/g.448196 Transcript_140582/m.448196 type:complete len:266 (-) Transcript_140582:836-1633(-)